MAIPTILFGILTGIYMVKYLTIDKKGELLIQKLKKWPKYTKSKQSNKAKLSEFNIEEHENDIVNFLNLMEMHGYNGAKKLADKHNWEIMIKKSEWEIHMNKVKNKMK